MKNLGGLIILLAAFVFIGAILAMVFVATTEYQHLTYPEMRPTDPAKVEESKDELQSSLRIGVVLGVGAVLVLMIGLGIVGTSYLQKAKPPAGGTQTGEPS